MVKLMATKTRGGDTDNVAQRLAHGAGAIDGVTLSRMPDANAVFARLPRPVIDRLIAWSPFTVWDESIDEVRWMTSWATTDDDVDALLAGVAAAMAER